MKIQINLTVEEASRVPAILALYAERIASMSQCAIGFEDHTIDWVHLSESEYVPSEATEEIE